MSSHRKNSPQSAGNTGFTLVEILMTLTVAALLFVTVIRFMTVETKTLSTVELQSRMEDRMAVAFGRIREDIRSLGYDPAGVGSGNPYITVASATTFTFKGDMNNDNALETISYRLNGTVLERSASDKAAGGFLPLAKGIQSVSFVYHDINGNNAATLASIRLIQLTIVYQTDAVDRNKNPPQYLTLSATESFVPRSLSL